MVIKNAKSNTLYHFIEVMGTNEEIGECNKWCIEQFGITWNTEMIVKETAAATRLAAIIAANLASIGQQNPNFDPIFEYRYRLDKEFHFETSFTTWGVVLDFESEAHYNWFILRFS
jgi:hypothetical protein